LPLVMLLTTKLIFRLLISAAFNFDSGFKSSTSKSLASGRRLVFMHEVYNVVDQDDIVDEHYGIDIGIDFIQANVNIEHPKKSRNFRIPFSQWKQLSQ
jgi:hypothetical protein